MLRVKCYMAVSKIDEITRKYMNPYIYACNRILVTLSYIASSKCSQSNNKYTPNREIPSTSSFFFSFFTCRVEGCCIKAANGKFP